MFVQTFYFADFLIVEGGEQGVLQKKPVIAFFEEQFKTASLRKANW